MKERPILYSTPMIQAKLAGRKTQTRRIIKESFNGCLTNGGPHRCPNDPVILIPGTNLGKFMPEDEHETVIDYPQVRAIFHCSTLDSEARCPYGKVGDILWARETWCSVSRADCVGGVTTKYHYKADLEDTFKWKPSIHMPKSASRIWERITDIRVERLQDISEEDAIAEGIERTATIIDTEYYANYGDEDIGTSLHPIESYRTLWQSINGPDSWELSPWVWVIETETLSLNGRPKNL